MFLDRKKNYKAVNMSEQSDDPNVPSIVCANWKEIVNCLEEFPAPSLSITEEGEVNSKDWIFRGLTDSCFRLEPAIERYARHKKIPWLALEKLVTLEFKTRARLHINPAQLPDEQDNLTWLAQMQHYAIPTRLLDFTYSPFVALYFAIRERQNEKKRSDVRLWAIDSTEVNDRFRRVANLAQAKAREQNSEKVCKTMGLMNPDSFMTIGDEIDHEIPALRKLIDDSIDATGPYRTELERQGCVAVALPPAFNPRLACQQGVFMVNSVEEFSFCESLNKMMANSGTQWGKRFDIAADAVLETEQRLFQMNIHEQTLFPDMEGLGGFIRQKIRLHWK
jgi:hypothetical protein